MAKNGEAEKPLESESESESEVEEEEEDSSEEEEEDSSEEQTHVAKKPSSDSLGPAPIVKSDGGRSKSKKADPAAKSHFQRRVWSEKDEMEVLKGMIDINYATKKTDLNAFHELIKTNLHVDVSRTQLRDKIRKLKRKYMKNKSKEEKEGKHNRTSFSNAHEHRAYELSKKVWGDGGGNENENENEKETEAKEIVMNVEKQRLLAAPTTTMTVDATVVGRIHRFGMMELLFETETEEEEEEKAWKKLRMEEIDAHHKLLELKRAQSKLVFDRLLNSKEDH
ncbi:hypothetical protein BUALT_Bualt17G0005900 [Buddleja alternifolia]|uniref:Glabrous enhancer-binding protein-like DBD domain-containing protein n=1 Tax=Buddleja alternifolia TaxID=168488 RepID=A0AAV6WAN7_9LAMI|nr:hypothetical protein BUALT_Bualt17G0005900 [Buddleja alternifolia]